MKRLNADGKLSVKELSEISESIAQFDADQSGTIDSGEFAVFAKANVSNGVVVNRLQQLRAADLTGVDWAKRQIDKYDKNHDGKLTENEWRTMIVKPDRADANADGVITLEEFAKLRR